MRKKNEMKNQDIIDSFDYLSNAASTWDCTGLIQALPSAQSWNPMRICIIFCRQTEKLLISVRKNFLIRDAYIK